MHIGFHVDVLVLSSDYKRRYTFRHPVGLEDYVKFQHPPGDHSYNS